MTAGALAITSERLSIRPLEIKDASELSKATFETWEELNKWMQWAKVKSEMTSLSNCMNYLANCEKKFALGEDLTFGCFLKGCGSFVASIRIATFQANKLLFEFCGIWCRAKFQRKGYTSEAVKALIALAFTELHAEKLIISHAEGNTPSQGLIQKIGFSFTGKRSNHILLPSGENLDACLYEILPKDCDWIDHYRSYFQERQ